MWTHTHTHTHTTPHYVANVALSSSMLTDTVREGLKWLIGEEIKTFVGAPTTTTREDEGEARRGQTNKQSEHSLTRRCHSANTCTPNPIALMHSFIHNTNKQTQSEAAGGSSLSVCLSPSFLPFCHPHPPFPPIPLSTQAMVLSSVE